MSLDYAIDASSFGAVPGGVEAVRSAFQSWNDAMPLLSLTEAGFDPVLNSDANYSGQFYGAAGVGVGANIDVFMVPSDFSANFQSVSFMFEPTSVASAYIHRYGQSDPINSVDIYLSASRTWATDGSNFDIETVVLHEVGHALGFDHTNEAAGQGGENYDPYTFKPGREPSPADVMYSLYTGVKRTLTEDELGALVFVTVGPDVMKGDMNWDGVVNGADVTPFVDAVLQSESDFMEVFRGDFNFDNRLDIHDVAGFVDALLDSGAAPSALTVLQTLPEPGTALIVLFGAGIFCRRRH